jgi:calcium/calmodulin-dependent protein kinase kinase 2
MTSILGETGVSHFSHPPTAMANEAASLLPKSHSFNAFGQVHSGDDPALGSMSRDVEHLRIRPVPTLSIDDTTLSDQSESASAPLSQRNNTIEETDLRGSAIGDIEYLDPDDLPPFRAHKLHSFTTDAVGQKGHAHDPLEDQLYLYIGPSTFAGHSTTSDDDDRPYVHDDDDVPIVSESPGAADLDIYETAYRDEIERIMARAKEEQKEPNVYLTRRVDAKLMAISGLAGKWAAMGEEATHQIKDYTQFSARKARVTEVSRALRQAAREEYERRRQEHREWIATEKAKRAKAKEEAPGTPPTPSAAGTKDDVEERTPGSPQSPGRASATVWRGKAVDAGRQARTSLMGLMDMVKHKSRSRSKDEAS